MLLNDAHRILERPLSHNRDAGNDETENKTVRLSEVIKCTRFQKLIHTQSFLRVATPA